MKAPPLQRLLVPTDFSNCAAAAFAPVRWLAESTGAEILLVHVVDRMNVHSPYPVPDASDYREEMERWGRQSLVETAREQFGGLPVRSFVATGIPDEEIVRVAEREKADLVVLSTHGRTGWRHLVLGSVAERVVRTAPCPVLTVKPPPRAPAEPISEKHLAAPVGKATVVSV